MERRLSCAGMVCLAWATSGLALAQPQVPPGLARRSVLGQGDVPSFAAGALLKLNGRLVRAEKARLQLNGTLQDGGGNRPIQIEWQTSGELRIEEGGGNSGTLRFDGNTLRGSRGALTARDEALVESLAVDLPENLLVEMAGSAASRVIATTLKVAGATGPNDPEYAVIRLDLQPAVRRPITPASAKAILVNMSTDLVHSVRYNKELDGRERFVTTLFEAWTTVADDPFPGRIRRLENGVEVFRVTISQGSTGGRAEAARFQ